MHESLDNHKLYSTAAAKTSQLCKAKISWQFVMQIKKVKIINGTLNSALKSSFLKELTAVAIVSIICKF